jgi:hypothetical protein
MFVDFTFINRLPIEYCNRSVNMFHVFAFSCFRTQLAPARKRVENNLPILPSLNALVLGKFPCNARSKVAVLI